MFDLRAFALMVNSFGSTQLAQWLVEVLRNWHRSEDPKGKAEILQPLIADPYDRPLHQFYRALELGRAADGRAQSILTIHRRKIDEACSIALQSWGELDPIRGFADLIWLGSTLSIPGVVEHIRFFLLGRSIEDADALAREDTAGEILNCLNIHPAAAGFETFMDVVSALRCSDGMWRGEYALNVALGAAERRPDRWMEIAHDFSRDLLIQPEADLRAMWRGAIPHIGLRRVFSDIERLSPSSSSGPFDSHLFTSLFELPLEAQQDDHHPVIEIAVSAGRFEERDDQEMYGQLWRRPGTPPHYEDVRFDARFERASSDSLLLELKDIAINSGWAKTRLLTAAVRGGASRLRWRALRKNPLEKPSFEGGRPASVKREGDGRLQTEQGLVRLRHTLVKKKEEAA
jgi:hypothetical protein